MSAVSALCLVHCSGTSGDKVTFLSGSTGYPANGVIGRNEIPLSDASLVFDDVTPSNARELRSEPVLGSTDANGNYSTSIEDTKVVILSAERLLADRFVQTSALIFTDGTIRVEPLNGVTTLAARSVKLAIEQRVIGTSDLTEPKIRQANQLAAEIAAEMEVDLDDDASVEAAATVLIPELFPGVELESSTIPIEEEEDELLEDGLSPDEMTEEPIDDVLFPPIESESGSESGEGEEVLN